MGTLQELWNTHGETGVLIYLSKIIDRLQIIQTDLARARSRRKYMRIRSLGRSRAVVESFQFSRLLNENHLDFIIQEFEDEERLLRLKIENINLRLYYNQRAELRGIYDWGAFED